MAIRKVIFVNDEIYHVFNRSVARTEIFSKDYQIRRMLDLMKFYSYHQNYKYSEFKRLSIEDREKTLNMTHKKAPLVEIFGFDLMPTHIHILIKQIADNGIIKFMSNIQNSYAKFFNLREERDGSLFKRPFKAKLISSEQIFIHVLRYIHLNPVTSFIYKIEDLDKCLGNSYRFYLTNSKDKFINTNFALSIFGSTNNLRRFTEDQVDYQRSLKLLGRNISK